MSTPSNPIQRIKPMLVKEFLQMFRDVRMRLVIFVMPVIQMTVMAFALTTDVRHIRTGVVDPDNTPTSRELVAQFTAGGYFEVVRRARESTDMARWLDAGIVRAVIRIPANFEGDLQAGRPTQVQLLADGSLNNDTAIAFNYAGRLMARFNQQLESRQQAVPGPGSAQLLLKSRSWYNPNLESKYYYVPALLVVMLLIVTMLLTSIAIVREKEIGTIEQVLVTPIRRIEFILGKTLPFLITGYITMTLMLVVAMAVFGIRVQGSIVLLYLLAGIFIVSNLGIALLISVSAHTQQQALLTAFFILLPAVLLSGFIFPVRNMPQAVQWLTYLNPLRWFLQILHGIVVRGVGLGQLWLAVAAQLALALCFTSLAVLKFRKTLS
ncbi:MAG: ABC transporter permease [Desulfobacterales bacterium]